MNVVYGEDEMKRFLEEATQVSQVSSDDLAIWTFATQKNSSEECWVCHMNQAMDQA